MTINIQLTERDLIRLVLADLSNKTGFDLTANDIKIEVKSKQNYKSEWETAEFRATVIKVQ